MKFMKQKIFIALLCSTICSVPALAAGQAKTADNLSTDQEKLGYVFGYNVGKNFRDHQIPVDADTFMQGLKTGLAGAPTTMTPGQMQAVMTKFQQDMIAKQAEVMKKAATENETAGDAFMKGFLAQKGVQKVDDNLAYKVVTMGSGAKPSAQDSVMITYEGKLIGGQVFDSTKRNNDKPVTLNVSQVIPGMQKILTMMPVGSNWVVAIGPAAAYGVKGIPNTPIGPNETLVFDLSLKSIVPNTAPTKPAAITSGAKA